MQYSRVQVTVGGGGDQVPALVPSLIQVIGVAPLMVYPVLQV